MLGVVCGLAFESTSNACACQHCCQKELERREAALSSSVGAGAVCTLLVLEQAFTKSCLYGMAIIYQIYIVQNVLVLLLHTMYLY